MFRLSTLGSPRTPMTDAVSTFHRPRFSHFARFVPFSDQSNFRRSRRLRLRFFREKGRADFSLKFQLRNFARERKTSYARASSEIAIVCKRTRGWAAENRFYALPSPVFRNDSAASSLPPVPAIELKILIARVWQRPSESSIGFLRRFCKYRDFVVAIDFQMIAVQKCESGLEFGTRFRLTKTSTNSSEMQSRNRCMPFAAGADR